jgi:hypothetical protein
MLTPSERETGWQQNDSNINVNCKSLISSKRICSEIKMATNRLEKPGTIMANNFKF